MRNLSADLGPMLNSPIQREQDGFSPRNLLEAAFRHTKLWISVVVVGVAITVLVTVLMHKQYESQMDILVQNARSEYMVSPERSNGATQVNDVTLEQVNSEIQVLHSKDLADVVVQPDWNTAPASQRTPEQLRAHDKAVEKFQKHLSIDLVHNSHVIHVAYVASSPTEANETTKRLLAAFMGKQREIERPTGTYEFFNSQSERYKDELDKAQQELAVYQQKMQLVSLPEKEATLERKISDLETEQRSTDIQLTEAAHRLAADERQLSVVPSRQTTQERTIPNQYSIEQLNTLLAQLKNKRTELLEKYLPEDRLVQENEEQIANTTGALHDARATSSQENATDVNPVWEQLNTAAAQTRTEFQAMRAKRAHLSSQIVELGAQLASVEGSTVDFSNLHRKVTELESNYQLYSQKRDEAKISDAMDEHKLLNVAVAQAPTLSYISYRKPLQDIGLGIFTTIFLACFMVYFAEQARDTVAKAQELEAFSEYPVLATVPFAPLSVQVQEITEVVDTPQLPPALWVDPVTRAKTSSRL